MKNLTPIKLVVAGLFLFALGFFVRNGYKLIAGNYILHESEIVKIDSFKLLGRARLINSARANATYEFQSVDGFSFSLGKPALSGIIDKREFEDTLLYVGLAFIAYSDKQTWESYQASKTPAHINLLQLQIGNKKYIDIDKANKSERNNLFLRMGVGIIAFSISFFVLYKKKDLTVPGI